MSEIIFFDIGNTLATGGLLSPRRLLGSHLALSEKETRLVGRFIMTDPSTKPEVVAAALSAILPGHHPGRLRDVLVTVWKEQVECVKQVEGAADVLRSLKAEGFKLGVISNTWHPLHEGFRHNCREILDLLDYDILSYRAGYKKPSLELYRQALLKSGRPASSCWMVGDSYELDIEPAQELGMHTVWIALHPEKEKSLVVQLLRGQKRLPDYVSEELGDILPFFMNRTTSC